MNEVYLTIADGFEKLAAGYRALADANSAPAESEPASETEAPDEAPKVTMEDVYAVLAEKLKDGKRKEVKELLLKYDSGKLSGVKESDYPALLADAEAL
ncbi:MAG: hypothetical protein ACI4WY_12865 [Anaerovoracaceae bacterium]